MAERSFGVRLYANIAQYQAAMEAASQSTTKLSRDAQRDITKIGTQMRDVGRTMTRRMTVPLLAVGAGAVALATNFETSLAKVQALVGLTAEEVDDMKESVLALSRETAQSPQALADGLFFVTSAGLRGADALDALEFSAKAASSGLGTVEEVADLLTSAMNAYGPAVLSAEQATNDLTTAVRLGKFAPEELAIAMGRVLPISSAMGVEFHEVSAAFAAMSRTGTNAAESATQIRSILKTILSPSEEAKTALADVGLSAEFLQERLAEDGLLPTLELLVETFGENVNATEAVFGNIRALAGVMDMLGSNVEATRMIFADMADTTGTIDQAFATMSETTGFKVRQALADLQAALIELGEILLPVVADVMGALTTMAKAFADLPKPIQNVILAAGGLLAAFGPLLIIVGSLMRNFFQLRAAIVALNFAGMVSPIMLAATALGVLAGAWVSLTMKSAEAERELKQRTAEIQRQTQEKMAAAKQAVDDLAQSFVDIGDPATVLGDRLRALALENETVRTAFSATTLTIDEMVAMMLSGRDGTAELIAILNSAASTTDDVNYSAGELRNILSLLGEDTMRAIGIYDEFIEIERRTAEQTDDTSEALGRQAAVSDDTKASIEELMQAHQDLIDQLFGNVSRLFDYEQAVLGVEDGYASLEEAILKNLEVQADAEVSDRDKEASARGLRQEELRLAEQVLGVAEAFAAEQGAAEGSTEAAQLQIQELERQALKYPHLRDEIWAYILRLNEIPGTKITDVRMDPDHESFGKTKRAIEHNAESPRHVSVTAGYAGGPVRIPTTWSTPGGSVYRLAMGGITKGPVNALIGEAGQEAVLPLTRPRRLQELLSDQRVLQPVSDALRAIRHAGADAPSAGGDTFVFQSKQQVTPNDIAVAMEIRTLTGSRR